MGTRRVFFQGLIVLVTVWLASDVRPARSQTIDSLRTPDLETSLRESRALLRGGEYDRAIQILEAAIARLHVPPRQLADVYLLMVKSYVIAGNFQKSQPGGRDAWIHYHAEARRRIGECLAIRALRHTTPEPADEYPPEMLAMFAEARGRMFGSFAVVAVDPPGSTVILDADTVRSGQDGKYVEPDVSIGAHNVLIQHDGYLTQSDAVTVGRGATLQRTYRLAKERGRMWYASRIAAAVGTAAGVGLAVRGGSSSDDDLGAGRVLDLDPSVRASGMAGASNAVFWGDDPNDWANPAVLGLQRGVRYGWGNTSLGPNQVSDIQFSTHRTVMGGGGLGVGLPGLLGEHGSGHLRYARSEGRDEAGNFTGTFGTDEGVTSWGVGVNVSKALESVLRLAGYRPPELSRSFDAAFGLDRKSVHVALGGTTEGTTSDTDYGLLLRANLIDHFGTPAIRWPVRVDASWGLSVVNAEDAVVSFSPDDAAEPLTRTYRNGFAVRLATGTLGSGPSTRSWLPIESLTPLVDLGIAADFERSDAFESKSHTQRYGVELTVARTLTLRTGSVQNRRFGMHAATFGLGVGYRYKDRAGVRYDWATVPNGAASYNTHRHAVVVFFDPRAVARVIH